MTARFSPVFSAEAWSRVQRGFVRQIRRWVWGLGGLVSGAGGVFWLASEVWDAHDLAQQALAQAQSQWQVQAQTQTQTVSSSQREQPEWLVDEALWGRLPSRLPSDLASGLQQALQQHGLTVLSLRAMPEVPMGPLQSQTLALRLNGHFADWVRGWKALAVSGPVLTIERMSVVPLTQVQGVQLDLVLRVWFNPASAGDVALPAWPPSKAWAKSGDADADSRPRVFALAAESDSASSVTWTSAPQASVLTDDPMTWPVERIRLLGTWHASGSWQAVLSAGGVWVPVRLGQRMSREGHQVHAIRRDAVVLGTAQGQKLELNVSGGGR